MALEAGRTPGMAPQATPPQAAGGEGGSHLIDIYDAARSVIERDRRAGLVPTGPRYREFLDALGVAVYTTDAEGRITFFNEAAAAFWGRRPELGELWCGSLRLYHTDGRAMAHGECPMAVALREDRETHGGEATAERPDGSRVSFIAYPTPLHHPDGSMLGAVNVLVDVTARRQAERALIETTRALRGSNAVKDEFLGLVSHELRTPVTTIFGNAQMLRDRAETLAPEDRQSMVSDIAEDSGRLLGIIENLLLLTRIGAGAQPDIEPQVLDRVVRGSIAAFARRHSSRRIAFDGAARQLIVEADRTYIELLMENLLTNAHKYSPAEETIEVAIEPRPDEAVVTVRDHGIGLDDAAEDVFAPFYRTESARRQANGIGVGLAVCRRVVESHGGRIWAAPRDGGGSEFGFALPIVAEHGDSA